MNPNPSNTPKHSPGLGPVEVPSTVRTVAEQRGFGQPLQVRRETTMVAQIGIGLAVAAVGLVVSLLLAAYNSAQTAAEYSGGGGQHFFLPSGAVFLIGLAMAVRGLAVGTRIHYLYTGGLVSTRRSGPRSVSWPEVSELRTLYGRNHGQVTGYRVTGPAGISIAVPLKTDNAGRDPFIDGLIDAARQHDRPIH